MHHHTVYSSLPYWAFSRVDWHHPGGAGQVPGNSHVSSPQRFIYLFFFYLQPNFFFCDKEQQAREKEQAFLEVFHCFLLCAAWCFLSLLVLLAGYNITLLM